MALFNRQPPASELDRNEDAPAPEPPRRSLVPVSALPPERRRLGIFDHDDDNAQDVDFLKQIARQAERVEPAANLSRSPGRVESVGAGDDLDVFRDLAAPAPRPAVMATVHVPEIEISDLLDDLGTTAAALRLRRAA
jgi:hypothetical protein